MLSILWQSPNKFINKLFKNNHHFKDYNNMKKNYIVTNTTGCSIFDDMLLSNYELKQFIESITGPNVPVMFFLESTFSRIFIDKSNRFVFKLFHNSLNQSKYSNYKFFQDELTIYNKLMELNIEQPVIKCYCDRYEKIYVIAQRFLGLDGIELYNDNHFTEIEWNKNIETMPLFLNNLHRAGLVHMDIKLENMCYDGKDWHLIDWGFARENHNDIKKITGTLPFIHPAFAFPSFKNVFEKSGLSICDKYSYAITMVTAVFNIIYRSCQYCNHTSMQCNKCKRTDSNQYCNFFKVDIEKIYAIVKNNNLDHTLNYPVNMVYFKILCRIVLSQVNVKSKYLVWSRQHKVTYVGINKHFSENDDLDIGTIDEAWDTLIKVISN